jgi:hypothetical protein
MAGVDAGECDSFSVHVSGSEVDRFKRQMNPWFVSTHATVQACAGLAPEEKAAWSLFYDSWRQHMATETPWLSSFAEWRATCVFTRSLDAWRTRLESACAIVGPKSVEAPAPEWPSALKWAAGAVIVAGGVYLVAKILP